MDFPDLFPLLYKLPMLLPKTFVPSSEQIMDDIRDLEIGIVESETRKICRSGKSKLRLWWTPLTRKEVAWKISGGGSEILWVFEHLLPWHPRYPEVASERLFDLSWDIDRDTLIYILRHFDDVGWFETRDGKRFLCDNYHISMSGAVLSAALFFPNRTLTPFVTPPSTTTELTNA